MKYPTEFNIRGYTYRVEYLEKHREVDRDFESDDYLGTCDHHGKVIRVLATQPLLHLIETLIHEVIHALFIRNKMLRTALRSSPGLEETFISTLSSDVACLLFDSGLINLPKRPPITTRILPEVQP